MLLIVYDVTSLASFSNAVQWIEFAKSVKWGNTSNEPIACALFANKTDLTGRRTVNEEKGKEVAEKYRMQYFEGSAVSTYQLWYYFIINVILASKSVSLITNVQLSCPFSF